MMVAAAPAVSAAAAILFWTAKIYAAHVLGRTCEASLRERRVRPEARPGTDPATEAFAVQLRNHLEAGAQERSWASIALGVVLGLMVLGASQTYALFLLSISVAAVVG
jgi:hypothetical protein